MALEIKNLSVAAGKKPLINGVSFTLKPGEVEVIMGPNGSGKSTLASTLLGHPKFTVTGGQIILDGREITNLPTDKRAKLGLFLSPQTSPEISGVSVANLLRVAYNSLTGETANPYSFYQGLKETMKGLEMDPALATRAINSNFSGGEKKRAELLQILTLKPKYAVLDEIDSGLDVDALAIVGQGIEKFRSPERGILLITHYNRLLKYVTPDRVHIMVNGRIVHSGGKELAAEIESDGFKKYQA